MGSKLVTEPGFYNGRFLKPGASYEDGAASPDLVASDLEAKSKDELLAEAASRGLTVKPSDTKAEIISALLA